MDPSSIIDVIVPYLERSGMGTLVTVCLSVILIATTIWIIAWVLDHRSIKNLIKDLSCLIDFSKKRFRKVNASPYDSLVTNSKIFNIIEVVYLYVVFGTMALYGTGTIVIGITGKANVWWGNAAVMSGVIFQEPNGTDYE